MKFCRTALIFLLLLSSLAAKGEEEVKPGSKIYTIQIGSFRNREEAVKLIKKLKDLKARIVLAKGRYKVRIGVFRSYKEAYLYAKEHKIGKVVPDFFISKS
ncbi:SPOR domain-containing protein, partial [Thermovibrio sp.]